MNGTNSLSSSSSFINSSETSEIRTASNMKVENINRATSSKDNTRDSSEDLLDLKGKVESRLLSMWNNVKFGWTVKLKTTFSKESPVWLLGRCYHRKLSPSGSLESSTEIGTEATANETVEQIYGEGIEGFKSDFVSRIWMTYRREFPTMAGSTYTSDCGWGCMLRSGQMLLAQALICHFLGRSWRWLPDRPIQNAREFQEDCIHRMIIKWFGDKSSVNSPLSIHQMVSLGEALGKKAGDWYGPASVAHCLKAVMAAASKENYEFDNLEVYVAQESTVYLEDVNSLCRLPNIGWKSLILLVPVKLGTDKLNPIYSPCLTSLLTLDFCIGIIGGRPKHSLYFVGYQDDRLIHLDPHYCQEMVDVWQPNFSLQSFHCRSPRKMPISKMDPSCCIGFYLPTQHDFETFVNVIKTFIVPQGMSSTNEYPMFTIQHGSRKKHMDPPQIRYSIYESELNWTTSAVHDSDTDLESEEFVLV
ncbi:PREDICTED: cysteine protease ATG4D [Papilio xuthus]|uniref:Cysteine protease n=3 Tax=Papilio xuthus TaxID=66420 RepID=A0AAJ6ZEM9_PAPXU|nr:PREDICTED: cysteine protease ATG4D [Papilio xuthus]